MEPAFFSGIQVEFFSLFCSCLVRSVATGDFVDTYPPPQQKNLPDLRGIQDLENMPWELLITRASARTSWEEHFLSARGRIQRRWKDCKSQHGCDVFRCYGTGSFYYLRRKTTSAVQANCGFHVDTLCTTGQPNGTNKKKDHLVLTNDNPRV